MHYHLSLIDSMMNSLNTFFLHYMYRNSQATNVLLSKTTLTRNDKSKMKERADSSIKT